MFDLPLLILFYHCIIVFYLINFYCSIIINIILKQLVHKTVIIANYMLARGLLSTALRTCSFAT